MPSSFTISWLESNDVTFGLSRNNLDKLKDKKLYKKYLIGKVLKENRLVFPDKNVPDEIVVEEFTPKSPIWEYAKNNYPLICYIIKSQIYKSFDKKDLMSLLPPLYRGDQDAEFFVFVLDNVNDSEKIKYLCNMGEIVNDQNRLLIYKLLCQDGYMRLLRRDDVFGCVESCLWDKAGKKIKNYRGVLTRKRRDYLKR